MSSRLWIVVAVPVVFAGTLAMAHANRANTPLPAQPARPATAAGHQGSPAAVAAVSRHPSAHGPAVAPPPQRVAAAMERTARGVHLRDTDRVAIRAEAIAQSLELPEADRQTLVTILQQEQSRRATALSEWRRHLGAGDAASRLRDELNDIRDWKTQALRDQFGIDRANQIMKRR